MKKGFGLISALIIMLLIATLMVAVVKFAFISVNHTSDTYLQQRAQLFMQSAIENAILAIEGYDRNISKCLKHITFRDEKKRFKADVDILRYYFYKNSDEAGYNCDNAVLIDTDKSHGNVLLKVVVESNNSNPRNFGKHIRIQKITLQRP